MLGLRVNLECSRGRIVAMLEHLNSPLGRECCRCIIRGHTKRTPDYTEGLEAFTRFRGGMQKVLSVSHDEIQRRIAAEREQTAKNPHKRGPKPKPAA